MANVNVNITLMEIIVNIVYLDTMMFLGCLVLVTKRTSAKVSQRFSVICQNNFPFCVKTIYLGNLEETTNFHYISECDCHDHSDTCYFNPSIFVYSGNVTGGVCENCTHNTEGHKCESCIEGFYQDPAVLDANGELDLNSPDICKREFYNYKK